MRIEKSLKDMGKRTRTLWIPISLQLCSLCLVNSIVEVVYELAKFQREIWRLVQYKNRAGTPRDFSSFKIDIENIAIVTTELYIESYFFFMTTLPQVNIFQTWNSDKKYI